MRRFLVGGFLLLAALTTSALAVVDSKAAGPRLGLQTWTCRNMTFEQTVEFAVRHGIQDVQFFPGQFDPTAPKEETLRKKAILEQRGLRAYAFGVCQTSLDKEANRKLFEFAKLMGNPIIVVEPGNPAIWDSLEELVKEYDVRLAIHNHNLNTVYGDPATVKKVLAARDARIGVCLDVGWITAAGFDAAKVFREYDGRVYDIHFKDKVVTMVDGKAIPTDTEIGKGQANYAGLFAEVRKAGWSGVMAIETDSKGFAEDPNRLVEEAKTFFAASVAKQE